MKTEMRYGLDYHFLPVTSLGSGNGEEVLPDLYCHTVQVVNICFVGRPQEEWVLVDAGMPGTSEHIIRAAENRFGPDKKPKAIILTHGHFDHVGAIIELVDRWDVPIYAHRAEMPYLTGKERYVSPDPSVEGGMIAKMSPMFPIEPIQLGDAVRPLPSDGTIPEMADWRWIHTPGHTPGHVSLFREKDRTLIAGDAFVTVRQDALYKVFVQERELNGPPRYLTPDWETARKSVEKLAALKPAAAVTGHGLPICGDELSEGLEKLAAKFDEVAVPDTGKYVNQ